MDRRFFLRSIPAAGIASAFVGQSVALAIEPAGNISALIAAHRAAVAAWKLAKAAGVELEDAIREDRHRRCPMAAMPGIGSAEICIMERGAVQRMYDGAMLTVFASRGVDGDALMAEALSNYDAAWKAEEERAEEMGAHAAVFAEHDAGEAVIRTLSELCACAPADGTEAAERREYLVPLLSDRSWAWGLGTTAEWSNIYSAAMGGGIA